jgi:hypothetical protein
MRAKDHPGYTELGAAGRALVDTLCPTSWERVLLLAFPDEVHLAPLIVAAESTSVEVQPERVLVVTDSFNVGGWIDAWRASMSSWSVSNCDGRDPDPLANVTVISAETLTARLDAYLGVEWGLVLADCASAQDAFDTPGSLFDLTANSHRSWLICTRQNLRHPARALASLAGRLLSEDYGRLISDDNYWLPEITATGPLSRPSGLAGV